MKRILYLVAALVLFSASGCVVADRDHDHDHWDHHDHDWDHDHDHP